MGLSLDRHRRRQRLFCWLLCEHPFESPVVRHFARSHLSASCWVRSASTRAWHPDAQGVSCAWAAQELGAARGSPPNSVVRPVIVDFASRSPPSRTQPIPSSTFVRPVRCAVSGFCLTSACGYRQRDPSHAPTIHVCPLSPHHQSMRSPKSPAPSGPKSPRTRAFDRHVPGALRCRFLCCIFLACAQPCIMRVYIYLPRLGTRFCCVCFVTQPPSFCCPLCFFVPLLQDLACAGCRRKAVPAERAPGAAS